MRITDKEAISENESDLIEMLSAELDWGSVEAVLKDKFDIELNDDVAFSGGDMVIHQDQVAYKLNYDVRITLSLVFGRDGKCLAVSTERDDSDE